MVTLNLFDFKGMAHMKAWFM